MPDTPDVDALHHEVACIAFRMADEWFDGSGVDASERFRIKDSLMDLVDTLADLARKATPPDLDGWQAIANCPGVPCNKPECIYYDQPDEHTWTCSIPRIQDVAAALNAANARADWLAQRLAEYAGCPGVNGHGCAKPDGCVLPEDEAACWQATAAREVMKR